MGILWGDCGTWILFLTFPQFSKKVTTFHYHILNIKCPKDKSRNRGDSRSFSSVLSIDSSFSAFCPSQMLLLSVSSWHLLVAASFENQSYQFSGCQPPPLSVRAMGLGSRPVCWEGNSAGLVRRSPHYPRSHWVVRAPRDPTVLQAVGWRAEHFPEQLFPEKPII